MLPLSIVRMVSDSPLTPTELVLQDIAENRIPPYLYKYRDTGENTRNIFYAEQIILCSTTSI